LFELKVERSIAASVVEVVWVGAIVGQASLRMVCVPETSIEIFDADVELCNLMRARTGATG
jgi:hypothetical protein